MGPYARLSKAQQRLRSEDPSKFAIDAWQFSDVGRAASAVGSPFGAQITNEDRFPWRLR